MSRQLTSARLRAGHSELVKRAGYSYAVTTYWGTAGAERSLSQMPRFVPWDPHCLRSAWQPSKDMRWLGRKDGSRRGAWWRREADFVLSGGQLAGAVERWYRARACALYLR